MAGLTRIITDVPSTRSNTRWKHGSDYHWFATPHLFYAGASGAEWGRVKAGTVVGQITASSKIVPVGIAVASTTGASATHTFDAFNNFRVGDVVTSRESDGTEIDAGLEITAINTSNGEITFDSSTNITSDGYIQREDGSGEVFGVLMGDVHTAVASDENRDPIHDDVRCSVGRKGIVKSEHLENLDTNDVIKGLLEDNGHFLVL